VRFIYSLAALVVLFVAFGIGGPRVDDTPKAAETRKKLNEKITLDIPETALYDALDLIKEKIPGLGIRLDTAGGVSRNIKVSFKGKDKTLAEVLDKMFAKNGYGYVVTSKEGDAYDGTILIKQGAERGYALDEMPAKGQAKTDATAETKGKGDSSKTVGKKAPPTTKKSDDAPKKTEDPPANDPEREAAGKLQQAKDILKDGKKDRAKDRLHDIVTKYPDTKAAEEAKQMLKDLEP
jgi:hypothetical protein